MPSFRGHPGFALNSVRSSPWDPTQLVVTAADNFGISGTGKVYVIKAMGGPMGAAGAGAAAAVAPMLTLGLGWGTSDGAFDACFSEADANLVIVGCGDGVKIYHLGQAGSTPPAAPTMPIAHMTEHGAEVCCVTWAHGSTPHFATASWDRTVKIWPAAVLGAGGGPSLCTLVGHTKEVYEAAWNPHQPAILATASGDGTFKLWDVRQPSIAGVTVPNGAIVLSCDWNRYDTNMLATGSVDQFIRLHDVRKPLQPLVTLKGHDAAVRRVRFSPFTRSHLLSSGYDFRVNVFDLERPQRPLTARYEQHREFVVGLDWSYVSPGVFYSASWDGSIFSMLQGQPPVMTAPEPLPPMLPPPRPPNASSILRRQAAGGGGPTARGPVALAMGNAAMPGVPMQTTM